MSKYAEREGAEGAKKHRKSIINSNLITQIKTKIGYCEKNSQKWKKNYAIKIIQVHLCVHKWF